MPSVFISYSHADFEIEARKTSNYIKEFVEDCDVFLDRKKTAGGEWEETIRNAIGLCDIFIVVLTYAALKSNAIETEVALAKEKDKEIVPCKDVHLDKSWSDIPWSLGSFDNLEFENGDELRRLLAQKIDLIKEITLSSDEEGGSTNSYLSKPEPKTQSPLDLAFIKTKKAESSSLSPSIINKKVESSDVVRMDNFYDSRKFKLPGQPKMNYDIVKPTPEHVLQIIQIDGFPEVFPLSYFINKGKLTSGTFNENSISIILEIKPNENGTLKILLPRLKFDAKIGFDDDDYFILMDGEETDFSEEIQILNRILTIPFKANSKEIEIIGTHFNKENAAINMLQDKKYEYRTKDSLQRRTGMSDKEFLKFLKKHKEVRKSYLPDKHGRELYQLK